MHFQYRVALHPSGARAARLAGGAGTHTALHSGGARAAQNAGGLAAGGGSHAAWLCTRTELAHLGILAGWRPEEPRGSAAGNRTQVVRRLDVFLVLIVAIADYQSPITKGYGIVMDPLHLSVRGVF